MSNQGLYMDKPSKACPMKLPSFSSFLSEEFVGFKDKYNIASIDNMITSKDPVKEMSECLREKAVTDNGKKMKTDTKKLSKLAKRNESERQRVIRLNKGYDKLKKHIHVDLESKMSQYDIIMTAVYYIKLLKSKLNEDIEKNQNYLEKSKNDNNIVGNNCNQYGNQSFNQEINSLDYFQYTNGNVQNFQTANIEEYNQSFENINQQINTENVNQYKNEEQFCQSNNHSIFGHNYNYYSNAYEYYNYYNYQGESVNNYNNYIIDSQYYNQCQY